MQTVVTVDEMRNMFSNVKSCQPISVDIETEPKMLKTDNPFLGTIKKQKINGMIGFIYANVVNNQLGRQDSPLFGEFEPEPRQWGILMDNRVLVIHTPKGHTEPSYYLQIKCQSAPEKPRYFFQGKEIDEDKIKPFLPVKKMPKTQSAVGIQKEICIRDIDLTNIISFRFAGESYVVVHGKTVAA